MGVDNVITHIDPPKTRDQLALLLMRWNALNKQNIEPNAINPEMYHLTSMLKQLASQQRDYESRMKEVNTIVSSTNEHENKDLKPQLIALKLLSRGLDIPSNIAKELYNASGDRTPPSSEPKIEGRDLDSKIAKLFPRQVEVPEVVLRNRIAQRIIELERFSSNLGTFDASDATLYAPDDFPPYLDDLKMEAVLELKELRLLMKQKSMRQHIVYHIAASSEDSILGQSQLLRSTNKRIKLSVNQEIELTKDIASRQNNERERHARHSQIELIKAALHRAEEFNNHADQHKQRKANLVKQIVQYHSHIEREESKRAERTAKQRLQALRSNDEEAYIKLLDQTKDTRITHLLKQTNQFLSSLSEAVLVQQAEAGGPVQQQSEEELEKIDYYEVAHRIKEPVTEQASLLVGGKLKEYQLKGMEWMVSLVNNNLNGILADEMGLGKTIQSISLITYLIEKKHWTGPFLIIVPLSTITNWTVELDKWAPDVRKVVYKGPPNARKAQQAVIRSGNFQVLLTTYEYIIKDKPLLSKIRWQHMIIDEGHRMKNSNSKLSSTLVNHYFSKHRLILTGTPLQNNLPELWALLNFVLPKIFNSQKTFDEWFNTPFANTGTQDKMELTEEEALLIIRRLHKVLRPFLLRRLKKDVEKDLPDKIERVIKCKMSALQQVLYDQMLKYNVIYTGDAPGSDGKSNSSGMRSLNNKIMQLRKICNHPFVFQEVERVLDPKQIHYDLLWRTGGKFELLDRILPKFGRSNHRVLIFFQMTHIMDIMEDYLRTRGIQYLRLDGSTKADERSEKLKLFNDPSSPYFCFLLSTRAGGLGLNLQTADTVIIYDTDWNPFQDLQAQDRAHRIGQTKEVRIFRLITQRSIEEAILERAVHKLEIDGKVIQAGKFDNKSTNEEQEAFLRNLMEAEEARREHKDQEEEDLDEDELNQILARSESEIELFKKMDEEREIADAKIGHPRLFSEEELPDIYKEDLSTKFRPPKKEELGSRRERKRIIFDDMLTDEEWLKQQEVDGGADERESEFDSDDNASTNGNATSNANGSNSSNGGNSKSKGKRGRKPKSPSSKKIRTPEELAEINEKAENVLSLISTQVADDPPRSRSAIFIELPSKFDYPDYYKIIKKPISLTEIRKKISESKYFEYEEFIADLTLMFNNARTYNAIGSQVYEDANFLENLIKSV